MTAAASAVIGAGYGDEGKGLMVDALSSRALERPVVVRSNGGAQAGHTVTLADGRRHVFHHIGSGALAGAATHLSRFFVHHPMVLQAEMDALAALGGALDISADPRGRVTTPWDMLINQAVERVRDGARHGSCGLGFGETIERSLEAPFRLTVGDLARPDLRQRLDAIRLTWTPRRLQALGLARLSAQEAAILADDAILDVFIDDCRRFLDAITVVADADVAALGPVIFEGAQGLQLDQAIGAFPHVTRSHTGLVNMAVIAREAGLDSLDAVYVTRAYATRHGAGPIAHAVDRLEGFDVVDPTNVPNAWQGRMRYAPLDLDILAGGIAADLALTDAGALRLRTGVAVTCLDQARGPIAMIDGGVRREASPCELATLLGARIDQPVSAQGWGPARAGIHFHQAADGRAAWTGVSRHARRN